LEWKMLGFFFPLTVTTRSVHLSYSTWSWTWCIESHYPTSSEREHTQTISSFRPCHTHQVSTHPTQENPLITTIQHMREGCYNHCYWSWGSCLELRMEGKKLHGCVLLEESWRLVTLPLERHHFVVTPNCQTTTVEHTPVFSTWRLQGMSGQT
jgi:hypothetical protein